MEMSRNASRAGGIVVLSDWTEEDETQWKACSPGIHQLFNVWVGLATEVAEQAPQVLSGMPEGCTGSEWFRAHLEKHREAFCGSPSDPEVRQASRQIGFAHIQAQTPPSGYVSLYNLIFSAYHSWENQEDALPLPPLSVIRRRWLADMETTLDTYTVALAARITSLNSLATTDSLTGALNRRGFWQKVTDDIAADRGAAAFILWDLDHFKAVNDREGHPAGDRVLQQLAKFAHTQARDGDAFGRLGGDEFAWWAGGITSQDVLQHRLQDLASALFRQRLLTFSAGVAWYPEHGETVDQLYQAADDALYRAKRAGRQRWTLADHPAVYPL